MTMKREYRIREFDNKFYVEVKRKYTKGILWWRREVEEWSASSFNGGHLCSFMKRNEEHFALPYFESLTDAKKAINEFHRLSEEDEKYHYIIG